MLFVYAAASFGEDVRSLPGPQLAHVACLREAESAGSRYRFEPAQSCRAR